MLEDIANKEMMKHQPSSIKTLIPALKMSFTNSKTYPKNSFRLSPNNEYSKHVTERNLNSLRRHKSRPNISAPLDKHNAI